MKRLRCDCTGCSQSDCRDCNYCKEMKKIGRLGKRKSSASIKCVGASIASHHVWLKAWQLTKYDIIY